MVLSTGLSIADWSNLARLECLLDMQEVTGSSPVSPTIKNNGLRKFMRNPFSFDAHLDAAFFGCNVCYKEFLNYCQ